jgi:hypothetical protein
MIIESQDDPSMTAVSAVDRFAPSRVGDLGVDAQLDALLTAIMREPASGVVAIDLDGRRQRRLRRGMVVGVAAAVTLIGGGVAAAAFHSAHTGERAADPRITDHSEWLDTSGDDFPGIAERLTAGIPFAPHDGPNTYIGVALPTSGLVSTGGVRTWLATDAFCGWEGYWLQEHQAGDLTSANTAADALHQLATSGLLDSDADPVVGASNRAVAAAAAAGEDGPVRADWTPNCTDLPRPWAGK